MSEQVARYLDGVQRLLRARGVSNPRFLDEVREHLVDAVDAGLQRGLPLTAAEEDALARFGPPDLIAAGCEDEETYKAQHRIFSRVNAGLWRRKWWMVIPAGAMALLTAIGSYYFGEPRPGDLVVLYYPLNPEKMFVRRVIAREGDTVRIVDGRVSVNDQPLHDDDVAAGGRSHDDWGPQVIQQGYYFLMGDHLNHSADSRQWGFVPKKYIVGKVNVRWWPLQDARIF